MERAIQQTIDYTRERKAFGKSILDNQYVHFRLAEMESEVEALRSLVYRATSKNLCALVLCTVVAMATVVYYYPQCFDVITTQPVRCCTCIWENYHSLNVLNVWGLIIKVHSKQLCT